MKKLIAVGVIVLFIGLSLAPSINANLNKTSFEPIPDLHCIGDLNFHNPQLGETYYCNFAVQNIGEPDSLLDWKVSSWPEWGDWTFEPSSWNDFTPEDGQITVEVTIIWPEENTEYVGYIKLVNIENPDDTCIVDISISPKKNQEYFNTEMVEFTTEVCGLDGRKQTVQLTKEEAEEVEQLFDDIEQRLGEVETREEAVEIFNEAIVELDEYSLLCNLSVEQVQKLIVDEYSKKQAPPLFETRHHEKNVPENQHNLCCIVSGKVQDGYASSIISTLGYFLTILKISSLFGFIQLLGFFLILIGEFASIAFPFSIMKGITLFSANLTSLGLFGYIKHTLPPNSGTGKIFGFNGFKLTNIETGEINLLGFALAVIDFSNDCSYL